MNKAKEIIERIKPILGVSSNIDLSEKLGISYNTLNSWIKRGQIPSKYINSIVQNEQLSYDFVMNGNGSAHIEKKIEDKDVIAVSLLHAGAGSGIYNYQSEEVLLTLNKTIFKDLAGKPLTAVEVVGDSMEPVLRRGDYILITPPHGERRTEDGIYAIRIDGAIKIKALQFQLDGTIKIISYNQHYSPEIYDPAVSQVDFEIIGKHCMTIAR